MENKKSEILESLVKCPGANQENSEQLRRDLKAALGLETTLPRQEAMAILNSLDLLWRGNESAAYRLTKSVIQSARTPEAMNLGLFCACALVKRKAPNQIGDIVEALDNISARGAEETWAALKYAEVLQRVIDQSCPQPACSRGIDALAHQTGAEEELEKSPKDLEQVRIRTSLKGLIEKDAPATPPTVRSKRKQEVPVALGGLN